MFTQRANGSAPLQASLLPLYSSEKPQSPLLMAQLASVLHPRKSKQRTTLFALISLILLSTYVFIVHCPNVTASIALRRPESDNPTPSQLSLALESIQKTRLASALNDKPITKGEQVQLNSAQELAAISSFLASLPQNQIPPIVDPSKPIDPQLVLDFDTRGPRASQEVEVMVEDVWSRNPVFLYSKLYSSVSREAKAMLEELNLKPSPTIIDIDVREDAEVLASIITRLTSSDDLPVLIVGGKVVGSIKEMREMKKFGTLRRLIAHSGAMVDGARRKKKH